ncbi:hypothetical protein AABB24_003297 [Solanum stoloniferum]|uniref:BAH domain-containing protein n=1 Tax=Solanum stoloniferum TaxID=62892 RepID=A0ABD2V6M7_9SOLN
MIGTFLQEKQKEMVQSIHDSSPAIFERLTSHCDKYQMFPLQEAAEEDSPEFSWGAKKGKGAHNKDVQFYKSFTYAGVEFNLYDCVYMYRHGEEEPDIGKIVKVWETKTRKRIVKVVWFFRPTELTHWLGNIKVLGNELLLASGEGVGLSNCNPVEAITGKCNVVCISIDRRNPQPKDRDLETAEFLFYRTFDVGTQEISEKFPNSIAQIEVEHFFNKVTDLKQPIHYGGKGSLDMPHSFGGATIKTTLKDDQPGRNTQSTLPPVTLVKQTKSSTRTDQCTTISQCQVTELVEKELNKVPISLGRQGRQGNVSETDKTVARTEVKHSYCTPSTNALKKRKLQDLSDTTPFDQHKVMKSTSQVIEVTTRVKEGASTWFKELPWNDRLQDAQERGTLVLLENLDPSYASTEVEDIVKHALRQKVSAKMVQHNTFSNPLNGKAFLIFKSSEAAETAIFELKRRCLMLGDGRPVVARKGTIQDQVKSKDFPGRLSIGKLKFQKLGEEMRKAVSTSHYAQSNTIEHELAVEWRVLQEQSSLWWKALRQEQAAEIEQLNSKLKNPIKNSV